MKEFAEEMKKRTEEKTEEYFIKEENRIKSSLQTLHAELERMNQKRSALREEIKDRRKKCYMTMKSLDSLNFSIEKNKTEHKRLNDKTKKKGVEIIQRQRVNKEDELEYLRMDVSLKKLGIDIQNDRKNYLISGTTQPEELEAHKHRKVNAAALQEKLRLLGEKLKRDKSAIQEDKDQLKKDQGQLEVFQTKMKKEQQKKELIQQKRLKSIKEMKRKYSTLQEINQQLKTQHEKKFEMDQYSAMLKFWRYWTQIEGKKKAFFDKLGVEMAKEEDSEDESETQCQSPKRSRHA